MQLSTILYLDHTVAYFLMLMNWLLDHTSVGDLVSVRVMLKVFVCEGYG